MKKVWILVVMLLLSACGGGVGGGGNGAVNGSGSGGSGSGGGVSDVGNVPTATVAVVVDRSASASRAMMAPPVPTNARISITNPNVNGIKYKQIQTVALPGTTVLTVPIASGYTFELVTYVSGTINYFEEYAVTENVTVSAGTNSVTLTLHPIGVTLTVPDTLSTAQSYTVDAVSTLVPSPFQSVWRLSAQTSNYTNPVHLFGHLSATTSITLVAPVNNNQPGTVYFQGEFFIKSSMLNTGELYTNWAFVYPNPLWSDPTVSAILSVPSGTVSVTL